MQTNEFEKKVLEAIQEGSDRKMANFVTKYGQAKKDYTLQSLKKKGLIVNVERGVWALAKAEPAKRYRPIVEKPKKKSFVQKVKEKMTGVKDYGRAPSDIDTYMPIRNFDPANPPEDYIIVKMDHELLDEMLKAITQKKAQQIGVPCKKE